MKYRGIQLSGPRTKVVPFLRSEEEGGNIYFVVRGISDMSPFEGLCPTPKAPKIQLPGNITKDNVEDKGYKDEMMRWWKKRTAWMCINSIRPLPESMEWETVKYEDSESWENWQKEFAASGFSDAEVARLLMEIMNLNGLNEGLVEEARKSFLTIQAKEANGQSSHKDEAQNIPSGKPATSSA